MNIEHRNCFRFATLDLQFSFTASLPPVCKLQARPPLSFLQMVEENFGIESLIEVLFSN